VVLFREAVLEEPFPMSEAGARVWNEPVGVDAVVGEPRVETSETRNE
jgi:hypothetical protein